MSLIHDAILGVLRPATKAAAGRAIEYHSGITGFVYDTGYGGGPLIATMGGSGRDSETEEGINFEEGLKFFNVDARDIPVVPHRLDKIQVLEGGLAGQWFQVLPTSGAGAYEDFNHDGAVRTINCKWIPAPEPTVEAFGIASQDFAYGVAGQDFAYGHTNVL